MRRLPDSPHETHDLELVAAFAAGDATGTELRTATGLVEGCVLCATLAADLAAIAAALPGLPVPARSHDFQLTEAQAAALRPIGWRRILATFASPRMSFAGPLGAGMAALGLVGILVATGGVPQGGSLGGAAAQAGQTAAPVDLLARPSAAAAVPGTVENAASEAPSSGTIAGAAMASPETADSGAAKGLATDAAATSAAAASAAPARDAPAEAPAQPPVADLFPKPSTDVPTQTESAAPDAPERSTDQLVLLAGSAALIGGLGLIVLRWASQRGA